MVGQNFISLKFALCVVILFSASVAGAQSKAPSIIPAPLSFAPATGALKVSNGAVISFPKGDADAEFAGEFLAGMVQRTRGIRLTPRPGNGQAPVAALVVFRRKQAGDERKDSYDLEISEKGIEIAAADRGGLLYGAVTLWGLLSADGARNGDEIGRAHV